VNELPEFICDQNHHFHYPAKQIKTLKCGFVFNDTPAELADAVYDRTTETQVCPFCQSKTFTEYVEPEAEAVSNVLVIELSTGPQLAIDKALADGYKVVGRYAKQYVLEKCTPKEPTA
jgi:hypothetical protein